MLHQLLYFALLVENIFSDTIGNIDFGKIPSEGPFDIGIEYTVDQTRICNVSLIKNGISFSSSSLFLFTNSQYRAITLPSSSLRPVDSGFFIQVKISKTDGADVIIKNFSVSVENGYQGFHTVDD